MERTYWYYCYMVNGLCLGNNVTHADGPEFPLTIETHRASFQNKGTAIIQNWRKISEREYTAFAKYCGHANEGKTVPPVVKLVPPAAAPQSEPPGFPEPWCTCRDPFCPNRHPDTPA